MSGFRHNPIFTVDWFSDKKDWFRQYLHQHIDVPSRFMEIGVHEGMCTVWLLQNILTNDRSKIDCMDIFHENRAEQLFRYNINIIGAKDKVKLYVGNSYDIVPILNHLYDFIYIDGSHNAIDVLNDAIFSFRLLKVGGIMAFDDYNWVDDRFCDGTYPKEAIDTFLHFYEKKIEILHKNWQVWVKKI